MKNNRKDWNICHRLMVANDNVWLGGVKVKVFFNTNFGAYKNRRKTDHPVLQYYNSLMKIASENERNPLEDIKNQQCASEPDNTKRRQQPIIKVKFRKICYF